VPTSKEAGLPEFQVLSWLDAVCSHTAPWVFNGGDGLWPSRAQEHGKKAIGLSRLVLCTSKLGMRACHSWKNWRAPGSNLSLVMATPGACRWNGRLTNAVDP
jgi:hypothetical protein